MTAEYLSLRHLAHRMGTYRSMPIPLSRALKRSVVLTFVTNVLAIAFIQFALSWIRGIYPVSSDGFFIWITADVVNFLLKLSSRCLPFLLASNVLSLLMSVTTVMASRGLRKPVTEPFHWLGALATVLTVPTIIFVPIVTGMLIAITILTLIIWVIIVLVQVVCFLLKIWLILALLGGAAESS